MLYHVEKSSELLDADVSLLILQGGKLCGMFLVQCVTNPVMELRSGSMIQTGEKKTLYPVLLRATSDIAAGVLLLAVIREAERKYTPDTAVHVILRDSNYAILMDKLAPNAHVESWFLTAQVSDYSEWKSRKREFESSEGI